MSAIALPTLRSGRNAFLFALLLLSFTISAKAGPGHDHGPTKPVISGPASPRLVAVSETYELLAVLKNQELTIYLDRLKDTSPVINAKIEIGLGGETHIAIPQSDGTYKIKAQALNKTGSHEAIVTIFEDGKSDLLVGTLKIPEKLHEQSHNDHDVSALAKMFSNWSVLIGLAIASGVLLGAMVKGRTGVVIGLLIVGTIVSVNAALAGPGHDHGESSETVLQGDTPKRLPDGNLFLPKPTQRLLEVRTKVLSPHSARAADKLIGRVIADPNKSGLVQSTISGRLKPSKLGLPTLGQTVKAGDILAYVEPSFAPIDVSDVRQTAGELDQRIAVLDAKIQRQQKLVLKNVTSRANLEELEIERTGLSARRKQLQKSRSEPEVLVAPVDGVIAEVRVAVGQVVNGSDTLFRIVDPSSLWIEAISFDTDSKLGTGKARAKTDKGSFYNVKFVGRSRALQRQASVIHFRISNPSSELSIGSPVKVLIEKGEAVNGLIIPRKSVVQAPNGQFVVFKRLEVERYMPVAVRIQDLDGERVHVLSGLQTGDQIIIKGAPLVNQIR